MIFLTEKDDMFVRMDLLETRYQVEVEEILGDREWPEYSFWTGKMVLDRNTEEEKIIEKIHEDL